METPSSARMATRSENHLTKNSKLVAPQDDGCYPSDKGQRSALVDITNDSPIVGLAAGSSILKTPGSSAVKSQARRWAPLRTPGSGEALLRCQVKALLQKVDEETDQKPIKALSDASINAGCDEQAAEMPFKILLEHLRSPSGLLAPTPANTPVILGLPAGDNSGLINSLLEQVFCQANTGKSTDAINAASGYNLGNDSDKEGLRPVVEECQINRALLFDSPGKSDTVSSPADSSSCGSAVTYQDSVGSSNENCPSSAWSMQAHVGSMEEEVAEVEGEDEELEEQQRDDGYQDEADGGSEDGSEVLMLEGLCRDMSKMTVMEEERKRGGGGLAAVFSGKHTRFVYDSDGEMEEAEDEVASNHGRVPPSPSMILLKGVPTPKGKHLRFQEEEED